MKAKKLLTIEELSEAIDTPANTIRRWPEQGLEVTKKRHRGRVRVLYDLAVVKTFLEARGERKGAGRPGVLDSASADVKEQIAVALLRGHLARAERLEIEVAARKGELLDAKEVERGRLERIALVKTGFLAFASRVAPLVANRPPREVETRLESEVYRLLSEFAGQPVPEDAPAPPPAEAKP